MPLYDIDCPECGIIEDALYPRATAPWEIECLDCGATAKKLPTTFATAGIISSNPLVINSAGLKAESNSEVRQYLKENPTCRLVDRSSGGWKRKVEKLHERREKRVQGRGYKDWRNFQSEKKKEIAKTSSKIVLDAGAKNAS